MNWDAIGAIGEIVGAAGVILTLGYLALQSARATEADAMQSVIECHRATLRLSLDSDINDLATRGYNDYSLLNASLLRGPCDPALTRVYERLGGETPPAAEAARPRGLREGTRAGRAAQAFPSPYVGRDREGGQ